jgi:TPR repeat protein
MKRFVVFLMLIVLVCFKIGGQTYKDMLVSRAEAGDLNSQKYLAKAYLNGSGAYHKNVAESFKWINKAASQGDAESQYVLYNYYMQGIGCEKSFRLDILMDAAMQKYPKAMVEAGKILSQLTGKEKDGQSLLIDAYKSGENSALPLIASNYIRFNDYSNGVAYYTKATQLCSGIDRSFAYQGLSYCYINGFLGEKNLKKAHEMIDLAIKESPDEACFYEFKGMLYLSEGDMKNASKMWNKTVEASFVYAQESTSELARAMNHSIDYGIPISSEANSHTYAIVIANEHYKRVPDVPYAINDGNIFRKYLISTLGVPEQNIEYIEDGSLNDIKYALSTISQRCNAFKDQNSVIIYYAGHGVPDEKTSEAYMLPIDGFGTDPSSGMNLDDFYETLSTIPAKSIIVLLDACFSGAKRDGGMLLATRGITIKPKVNIPDGKLIVISATSSEETAFPIEEQKHGLFRVTCKTLCLKKANSML